jgi:hypothetical protein
VGGIRQHAVIECLDALAELGEPRLELGRFFAQPVPYEQALRQRLIGALTKRGSLELAARRTNAALELFNRVLTMDPANEEVLREIDRLSRRRRIARGLSLCSASAQDLLRCYFLAPSPLHPMAGRTRAARESWGRAPAGADLAPGGGSHGAGSGRKRHLRKPRRAKPSLDAWLRKLAMRTRGPHPQPQDLSLALRITTEADSLFHAALREYRAQVRRPR